jgi:hypothetical protein
MRKRHHRDGRTNIRPSPTKRGFPYPAHCRSRNARGSVTSSVPSTSKHEIRPPLYSFLSHYDALVA